MSQYIEPVKTALLFFPFVALLITLPYMLVQYRKYGAVLLLRTAVVYSFVLYLMCVYFLAVLPLPDDEVVARLTSPYVQPIPFLEVAELFQKYGFRWNDPSTWYRLVWNRSFFQIVANVAMLVPLGIYLRYYFGCTLRKTALLAFLASLFLELTQLTGLYGLYPRPYRLADVDDLMTNTLGGLLGYALAPLAMRLLPSQEQLKARAYRKSKQVSLTRRAFAALADLAVMLAALMWLFASFRPAGGGGWAMARWLLGCYTIGIIGYFVIGGWLMGGRTPGKALLHLKLVDRRDGGRPKLWQLAVRYGVLYLVVLPTPAFLLAALTLSGTGGQATLLLIALCAVLLALYLMFWLLVAVHALTHANQLLHGKWSMTCNVSTARRHVSRRRGRRRSAAAPS